MCNVVRLSACNTNKLTKVNDALRPLKAKLRASGDLLESTDTRTYHDSRYKYVTGRETARILELYEQGLSASEVGRQTDRPLRTVTDVLRRNGIKIRKYTPIGADIVTKMVDLYESGLSCAGVAKALGFSSSAVGKHLQRAGIAMRSKSEAAILRSKRENA